MYLNKVLLYGNLTSNPELKALPNGGQVTNFSLATNRSYKDKNGVKQELAEFHNVVAFGPTAELINKYMQKGRPIYVEGRLQTRSWDDKATGQKRYRTEIIVENFQFGPSGFTGANKNEAVKSTENSTPVDNFDTNEVSYPTTDVNTEDIPF